MKGIILAGGTGTRLFPATRAISKQLLPVFDKPMIYYPLSVLMLAGIREIMIISTPEDLPLFKRLLGNGARLGLSLSYAVQIAPRGLPEAFLIAEEYIGSDSVALVLGDNIFYGPGFSAMLCAHVSADNECVVFGHAVSDPHRFGIVEADADGNILSVEEKPQQPRANMAITGLFFFDNRVIEISRNLKPSKRGELEIVDVVRDYVSRGTARLVNLGRGFAWLDAGTHDSLVEAGHYVRALEKQQGYRIACLEEVALGMGFISAEACYKLGEEHGDSEYGQYVVDIARAALSRPSGYRALT